MHSKSLVEHLKHLELVLEAHQRYGMKLNVKKCNIVQPQIEYLGHLIGPKGISMVPAYIQRILEYIDDSVLVCILSREHIAHLCPSLVIPYIHFVFCVCNLC